MRQHNIPYLYKRGKRDKISQLWLLTSPHFNERTTQGCPQGKMWQTISSFETFTVEKPIDNTSLQQLESMQPN